MNTNSIDDYYKLHGFIYFSYSIWIYESYKNIKSNLFCCTYIAPFKIKKELEINLTLSILVVGVTRFELATPRPPEV